MTALLQPFRVLRDKAFARLYLAQAVGLLGDAFTWVGIALLAYTFGGDASARILATALTLRVSAFIVFGPYAGVLADRLDRKKILIITHLVRMAIVGAMPFITAEWQVYALVFLLNVFNAFFTPAYKAALPSTVGRKEDYADAIALSNATWQLLGVLGPGLAGIAAVFMGAQQIFFFDALSFLVAAVLIIALPAASLKAASMPSKTVRAQSVWHDILREHVRCSNP